MKWSVVICFAYLCCTSGIPVEQSTEKDELTAVDLPPPAELPSGDSNSTSTRIIGGSTTTITRYPYVVQVMYNRNLACGGSLVTRRHVLTAAHCFFNRNGQSISASRFNVRVGSASLRSGGTTRSVRRIITHERYNVALRDNDVAIALLASRVSLGSRVALAIIPRQGAEVPDGAQVINVGWGATNPNSALASSTLRQVTVRSVPLGTCTQRYNTLSQATNQRYVVTSNMVCSGLLDIGGADSCQGDNGGPLVYQGVVIGVVSWRYACGHPTYPSVNTKVAAYTNWINSTITQYGGAGPISSSSSIFLIALSFLATIFAAS